MRGMASLAPSSHCNVFSRHGRTSPLSPLLQFAYFSPSSSSSPPRKPLVFSSSTPGSGLSRVAGQRKDAAQVAAVSQLTGSVIGVSGLRFAVVVARFNEIVTKPLLEGALDTFGRYSVSEEDIDVGSNGAYLLAPHNGLKVVEVSVFDSFSISTSASVRLFTVKNVGSSKIFQVADKVVWVPGCFELGVVAQSLGKSGKYHAVICIGAVIRGDTSHYDAVVNSTASGVLSASLSSDVPCIFGVLTCDDMDQAFDRSGGKVGNKGSEAALTAIEMATLFENHLKV